MERPKTVQKLTNRLTRVIAPNPSPMTFWGTNSYILSPAPFPSTALDERDDTDRGSSHVLIDAGPEDDSHFETILSALPAGDHISHILITHAHRDHSAGARSLAKLTGAKIYAFGDATSGRSAQMQALAISDTDGGGEGLDADFVPDITLAHGEVLRTQAGAITALHTPGHMSNHLCFAWEGLIFSGDLIMGWSSSLISPPDGDAAAFRDSCEILLRRANAKLLPGHGDPVEDGHARITALLEHRELREQQILKELSHAQTLQTARSLEQITKAVYKGLDPRALPAAARNTFAHLIDLANRNLITATPTLHTSAKFHINAPAEIN